MPELIPFLNAFFQQIPALNLVAGDVDFFAETGTLFLTLRNREVYTKFQNELVDALRRENPAFKRGMSIASKPHITLGRKFPKDELTRLSVVFADISGPEAFQANRVQLMFENNGKMTVFHSLNLSA
jgi:hypothetical protein